MAFTRRFSGSGRPGRRSLGGGDRSGGGYKGNNRGGNNRSGSFHKSPSSNSPFRTGESGGRGNERGRSERSEGRTHFNRGSSERSEGRSHYSRSNSSERSEGRTRHGSHYSSSNSGGSSVSFGRNGYGSFKARGSRRGFGGYRGGGGRGRGRRGDGPKLDHSLFVRKAVEKLPEEAYLNINTFLDFKVNEVLKKNIVLKGFKDPTPIQDQSIDLILKGNDLIGIANTGTGKTAAFLIPLIDKISKNRDEKVLIIVPTRELATQIDTEFRNLSYNMRIYSAQCIGGASISNQIHKLKLNPNFVIGTPGRLKDLSNQGVLRLESFTNLVLDEVDRMVDMGFINDIKYLIGKLPEHKQSLFFSATVSPEIERLITSFMKHPKTVQIKGTKTSENVDQDIVVVGPNEKKIERLHSILILDEVKKVLIFVKTKMGADRLDRELYERGFRVAAIHGDKSQYKRQQALDKFKHNKVNILVATDVAARGLDIPNVSHVINYDPPATEEDYTHRIGRTGRANNKGTALTFVD